MTNSVQSYFPRDWSEPILPPTTLPGEESIDTIVALKDGKLAASRRGTIEIWDTFTEQRVAYLEAGPSFGLRLIKTRSGMLASCSREDNTLKIWDTYQRKCVATLKGHRQRVHSLIEFRDGRLVSWSSDRTFKVWDSHQQQCIATLRNPSDESSAFIRLRNDNFVTVEFKTIQIWDWHQRKCIASLQGHLDRVGNVLELSDGKLVSGSKDKTIKIWEIHTMKCVGSLEGHSDTVLQLTELRDGKLASGSCDNTIKIWDVHRKCCVATLKGHSDKAVGVLELKDGTLASRSMDGTIKIWDRYKQKCLTTLEEHCSSIYDRFIPGEVIELEDGKLAVSKWCGKVIKIWDAQPLTPGFDLVVGSESSTSVGESFPATQFSQQSTVQKETSKNLLRVKPAASFENAKVAFQTSSASAREVEQLRVEMAKLELRLTEREQVEALQKRLNEAQISIQAVAACVVFVQEWGNELQSVAANQRVFAIKTAEQKALLNHPNPNVGDYYEIVWMKLADTLLACKTMHSGHVGNSFNNNFITASQVLGYVGTAASMGAEHGDKAVNTAKSIFTAQGVGRVASIVGSAAEALPYVGVFAKVVGKLAGWVGEQN